MPPRRSLLDDPDPPRRRGRIRDWQRRRIENAARARDERAARHVPGLLDEGGLLYQLGQPAGVRQLEPTGPAGPHPALRPVIEAAHAAVNRGPVGAARRRLAENAPEKVKRDFAQVVNTARGVADAVLGGGLADVETGPATAAGMLLGRSLRGTERTLRNGKKVELAVEGNNVIARLDGKQIAGAAISVGEDGRPYVGALMVHPAHRRQGVATNIVDMLEESGFQLATPPMTTEAGAAFMASRQGRDVDQFRVTRAADRVNNRGTTPTPEERPLRNRAAAVRDPNDPTRMAEGANHGDARNVFFEKYGVRASPDYKLEHGYADAAGNWRSREEGGRVAEQLNQLNAAAKKKRELARERGLDVSDQVHSDEFLPGSLQRRETTFRLVEPEEFHKSISAAQDAKKGDVRAGDMLTVYEPAEYAQMRTFLSPDGKTGYAIKEDGDLVSVFNVGARGAGRAAVQSGIENGATKLDAFDGFLPDYYKQFGFEEVQREANWTAGGPDVVYMQLPGTTDPRRLPVAAGGDNVAPKLTNQPEHLHLTKPSAVRLGDHVGTGATHSDAVDDLYTKVHGYPAESIEAAAEWGDRAVTNVDDWGFVTSDGRFLTREEGTSLALSSRQVDPKLYAEGDPLDSWHLLPPGGDNVAPKLTQPPAPLIRANHQTWMDFDAFDRNAAAGYMGRNPDRFDAIGHWFTSERDLYGPRNVTADLVLKNPFEPASTEQLRQLVEEKGGATKFRQWLRDNGHDGVRILGDNLDGRTQDVFVVLDDAQAQIVDKAVVKPDLLPPGGAAGDDPGKLLRPSQPRRVEAAAVMDPTTGEPHLFPAGVHDYETIADPVTRQRLIDAAAADPQLEGFVIDGKFHNRDETAQVTGVRGESSEQASLNPNASALLEQQRTAAVPEDASPLPLLGGGEMQPGISLSQAVDAIRSGGAARRSTPGAFFDRNAPRIQGTHPTPPELMIPEPKTDRTTVSPLVEAIQRDPESLQRHMGARAEAGRSLPAYEEPWYELGGMRQAFDQLGGGGALTFRDANILGAAASSNNSVPMQNAIVTVANWLRMNPDATPADALRVYQQVTGYDKGLAIIPDSRGRRKGGTAGHLGRGLESLSSGLLVPSNPYGASWKTPFYFDALMGGTAGVPLDAHERMDMMLGIMGDPRLRSIATRRPRRTPREIERGVRLLTPHERAMKLADKLEGQLPLGNAQEYKAIMESVYMPLARQHSLPGSEFQAQRWIGGAPVTGVESPVGPSFQQIWENQMRRTLQHRGQKPTFLRMEGLFGDILKGRDFLIP